jgi:hypothetical protein
MLLGYTLSLASSKMLQTRKCECILESIGQTLIKKGVLCGMSLLEFEAGGGCLGV